MYWWWRLLIFFLVTTTTATLVISILIGVWASQRIIVARNFPLYCRRKKNARCSNTFFTFILHTIFINTPKEWFRRSFAKTFDVRKLEWWKNYTVKEFIDMFTRFDTVRECDRRTDRQRDKQRIELPYHILRVAKRRAVKKTEPIISLLHEIKPTSKSCEYVADNIENFLFVFYLETI